MHFSNKVVEDFIHIVLVQNLEISVVVQALFFYANMEVRHEMKLCSHTKTSSFLYGHTHTHKKKPPVKFCVAIAKIPPLTVDVLT